MVPKVSVIIPVYGAERYIERCARSLFGQTLDDIEFIFVNDKTPDRSMDVLQEVLMEYPHRKSQVKIIEMPVNSGVAAARTAGMKAMTGEYMIHCDPDDWVELDAYEQMYNKAIDTDADIVTCQFYKHRNGSKIHRTSTIYRGNAHDCLRNSLFDWSLCFKLIKTQIIHNNSIYPYEGINCGEDLNVIVRVLLNSNVIEPILKPLYHYDCDNEESITHTSIKENIEKYALRNMILIEESLIISKIEDYTKIMNKLKYAQKAPFLWNTKKISYEDARFWSSLWPESNKNFIHRHAFILFLYHLYLKKRNALNI